MIHMPRADYGNVKLIKQFIDEIRLFIEENPEYGYATPTAFVAEASRIHLRYLKELKAKGIRPPTPKEILEASQK